MSIFFFDQCGRERHFPAFCFRSMGQDFVYLSSLALRYGRMKSIYDWKNRIFQLLLAFGNTDCLFFQHLDVHILFSEVYLFFFYVYVIIVFGIPKSKLFYFIVYRSLQCLIKFAEIASIYDHNLYRLMTPSTIKMAKALSNLFRVLPIPNTAPNTWNFAATRAVAGVQIIHQITR